MNQISKREQFYFLLGLLLVTGWIFSSAVSYGYSHWDSTTYLKENPVFDQPLGNIIDDILNGNVHSHEILYIPVFYLVYLIELQLGFSPQVMHATGILIHLLNIVLLTICLTKN